MKQDWAKMCKRCQGMKIPWYIVREGKDELVWKKQVASTHKFGPLKEGWRKKVTRIQWRTKYTWYSWSPHVYLSQSSLHSLHLFFSVVLLRVSPLPSSLISLTVNFFFYCVTLFVQTLELRFLDFHQYWTGMGPCFAKPDKTLGANKTLSHRLVNTVSVLSKSGQPLLEKG